MLLRDCLFGEFGLQVRGRQNPGYSGYGAMRENSAREAITRTAIGQLLTASTTAGGLVLSAFLRLVEALGIVNCSDGGLGAEHAASADIRQRVSQGEEVMELQSPCFLSP